MSDRCLIKNRTENLMRRRGIEEKVEYGIAPRSRCLWPPGVGDNDLLTATVQDRRYGGGPGLAVLLRAVSVPAFAVSGVIFSFSLFGSRSNNSRSRSRSRKPSEFLHEAVLAVGVGLGDVLHVGADEDQAAGAALAFAGGDAGTDTALSSFEFGFLFRQFFPEILRFTLVLRLENPEARLVLYQGYHDVC